MNERIRCRAQANSATGLLNIYELDDGRFCCDIRIRRNGRYKRRVFKHPEIETVITWRDLVRKAYGLHPAKDE